GLFWSGRGSFGPAMSSGNSPLLFGWSFNFAPREGGGAPGGATFSVPASALAGFGGRASGEARRLPALHRGDFGLRDRASGPGRGPFGPLIRRAFARLHPGPVQP